MPCGIRRTRRRPACCRAGSNRYRGCPMCFPSASLTSNTRTSALYVGISVRSSKVIPKSFVREHESAGADVLELEVRPEHLVVEVVLRLSDLLRVVPPVPGCELEALSFLVDHLLERSGFSLGARERGCPELVEEVVDGRGLLRHRFLEREIGVGLVAREGARA